MSKRLPLGEKRNLACSLAAGEILAHWDDDDWSAPSRLADQVGALTATDADVCGLSAMRYVDLRTGQGWLWRTDRHDPWLFGSSLCYRIGAWAQSPFAAVDSGEDAAFVAAIDPRRRCDLGDLPLVVATLHGGNTSSRHAAARDWHPLPATEVAALVSEAGGWGGEAESGLDADDVAQRTSSRTRASSTSSAGAFIPPWGMITSA
jgi:hypothetical protein